MKLEANGRGKRLCRVCFFGGLYANNPLRPDNCGHALMHTDHRMYSRSAHGGEQSEHGWICVRVAGFDILKIEDRGKAEC